MQKEEKTGKDEQNGAGQETRNADNTAESGQGPADSAKKPDQQELEARNAELNEKYLRLYSEYDNYRKRTAREKAEIIKTAGEDIFRSILPVIDDFERAIKASETQDDVQALKEGMKLIYNKFRKAVEQKGLQPFDSVGQPFDPDLMEAITHIPAEDKNNSGKVVDEVEKGYRLGEKVIRFAKVVVGQ